MCDLTIDTPDAYCEKFKLEMALHKLITKQTTQDQDGVSYVRVQLIENLMKELQCSI